MSRIKETIIKATFFDNDHPKIVGGCFDVPVHEGVIIGFWEPTDSLDEKTVLFEINGGPIIRCRPRDIILHGA